MVKLKIAFIVLCVVILGYGVNLMIENKKLKTINGIQESNIESLVFGMDSLMLKNNQQAVEVKSLRLTKGEFESYKKDAAKTIENMGIKIKNLQSYTRTDMALKIPINGKVNIQSQHPIENLDNETDSICECDDEFEYMADIDITNEFLDVKGVIVGDSIGIEVSTEVKLEQAVSIIPKHKFLWWSWGVKGIKQTITTNNPYVEIKYSESILLEK